MKLKLFPFFILSIFLFTMLFIPLTVSASETEYISVDFEDDTNGPFNENWGSNFQIVDEGLPHDKVLKDIRVGVTSNYQYADMIQLPDSFEIYFDFKSNGVGSAGSGILYITETDATTYTSNVLFMNKYGYLTLNSFNTSFMVNDGNWHGIFINITGGSYARISVDDSELSAPYSGGSKNYDKYVTIGNYATDGSNSFYWDNIVVCSRMGSIPTASFDYTPNEGDGLTNFLFTDTTGFDVIPFEETLYWDFGDGNYTYGANGATVNHTYIHAGTYQVILNASNRLGYDLAYTNITVSAINIGIGGEEITDDMFGFIIVILLITGLNILGMKTGYLMLSVFAILGMIIAIPALWVNDPLYITLMMVTALGNVAMLAYGLSRD